MSSRFASILALTLASLTVAACANKSGHGVVDMGTGTTDMGTSTMDMSSMTCEMTAANEDTLALCSDGCDNDGNTYADCNDFGCCDVLTGCGPTTTCGRPDDGGVVNACDGGSTMENTIAACTDGCNNDGDAFADCDDFDCCSLVACGAGTSCGDRDGGSVVVTCGGELVHENTIETCSDGCSNDGNRYVDCEERSCCGIDGLECGPSTFCGTHDTPSTSCTGAIVPENTAERCADECSNDEDPFVDCDDYDCCDVVECGSETMCGMSASDGGTAVDAG